MICLQSLQFFYQLDCDSYWTIMVMTSLSGQVQVRSRFDVRSIFKPMQFPGQFQDRFEFRISLRANMSSIPVPVEFSVATVLTFCRIQTNCIIIFISSLRIRSGPEYRYQFKDRYEFDINYKTSEDHDRFQTCY